MKYLLLFLAGLLVLPAVSGTEMALLDNTDRCIYQPDEDMDFCYSTYEICVNDTVDSGKINFIFRDDKTALKDAKETWKGLGTSVKIKTSGKGNKCKIVNITGTKNPYVNIDNIPCYGSLCWPEYAWWNSSYEYKVPINASCTACSASVLMPHLVNGTSGFTINGYTQYLWCNYTIPVAEATVGYFYFRDTEEQYACVNSTDNGRVGMYVDEGNDTSYGTVDDRIMGWYPFNGTDLFDMSIYSRHGKNTVGMSSVTGIIGNSTHYDGISDRFELDNLTDTATTEFSICGWFNWTASLSIPISNRYGPGADYTNYWALYFENTRAPHFRSKTANVMRIDIQTSTNPITGNEWFHLCMVVDAAVLNGVTFYINGTRQEGNINSTWAGPTIGGYIYPTRVGEPEDGNSDFHGEIDNLRFWNRSLSDDDVYAIYGSESSPGETEYYYFDLESPDNTTYLDDNVSLTFHWNAPDACDTSLYSLNGGANVSTGCANTTFEASIGSNTLVFYANNTVGANAQTRHFTVQPPVVNCTAGSVEAIKFTFYLEENLTAINGDAEYTLHVINDTNEYYFNKTESNVSNFSICIMNGPWLADLTLIYDFTVHDQRRYYIYHGYLDNTTENINLYQIPSADSEKVEITVKDANDNAVEDAYVNIQRYYVGENIYRTVTIGLTDTNGKFLAYLYTDNVFYQFTISLAGTVSNMEGPMTITDTTADPEELTLYTAASETQYFEMRKNVGTNCYINYTTNYTICTVADATGMLTSARLLVQHFQVSGPYDICDTSSSGSSFTLSCFLGADANGTYLYKLFLTPDPNPIYMIESGYAWMNVTSVYESYGLFPAFMLVAVSAGLAVLNPALGSIAAVMGLAAGATLGMVDISLAGIISLFAVAMILFMRRGAS